MNDKPGKQNEEFISPFGPSLTGKSINLREQKIDADAPAQTATPAGELPSLSSITRDVYNATLGATRQAGQEAGRYIEQERTRSGAFKRFLINFVFLILIVSAVALAGVGYLAIAFFAAVGRGVMGLFALVFGGVIGIVQYILSRFMTFFIGTAIFVGAVYAVDQSNPNLKYTVQNTYDSTKRQISNALSKVTDLPVFRTMGNFITDISKFDFQRKADDLSAFSNNMQGWLKAAKLPISPNLQSSMEDLTTPEMMGRYQQLLMNGAIGKDGTNAEEYLLKDLVMGNQTAIQKDALVALKNLNTPKSRQYMGLYKQSLSRGASSDEALRQLQSIMQQVPQEVYDPGY